MKYPTLKIIGTSHIAKQSVDEVVRLIQEEKPAIVALELDKDRFRALFSKKEKTSYLAMFRHIGVKGMLFALIGSYIQQKLGKYVKSDPGDEMKAAAGAAKSVKAEIALIDQHISITLRNLSRRLSWKERYNFFEDIFKAIFFRKRMMKRYGIGNFDLTKVPSKKLIETLMKELKQRYPNIYDVLVEERNKHMAKQLARIISTAPEKRIIAVVGAGHEEGIKKIMGKLEIPSISYSFTTNA